MTSITDKEFVPKWTLKILNEETMLPVTCKGIEYMPKTYTLDEQSPPEYYEELAKLIGWSEKQCNEAFRLYAFDGVPYEYGSLGLDWNFVDGDGNKLINNNNSAKKSIIIAHNEAKRRQIDFDMIVTVEVDDIDYETVVGTYKKCTNCGICLQYEQEKNLDIATGEKPMCFKCKCVKCKKVLIAPHQNGLTDTDYYFRFDFQDECVECRTSNEPIRTHFPTN